MGRSPPIKPTKVTLFTIIWYNTENNFRDSMRLDYQILLKSPPPGADTGGDAGDASPPTRPIEVLT